MATYSVTGRTAATAATADHAIAELWNPDASKAIVVYEAGLHVTIEGAGVIRPYITRATAQGTAGSTVTPDGDNCWGGDAEVPPSGAVLSLAAFSVQPTLSTPAHQGAVLTNVTGNTGMGHTFLLSRGFTLRAGTGLAICQSSANATPASDVYFVWDEP